MGTCGNLEKASSGNPDIHTWSEERGNVISPNTCLRATESEVSAAAMLSYSVYTMV